MKKFILLVLLLAPLLGWSQSVPNGTFEEWVPDPSNPPAGELPANWTGSTFGGGVSRITSAQSGSAAVRVKAGDFMGTAFPSLLSSKKFPVPGVMRYLNGYVRKTGGPGDTLYMSILYSQGSGGIAAGSQQKITLAPQWTAFSIEVFSTPGAMVDSATIMMIVQGAGDGFDIDNLTLSNTPIGAPLGTRAKLQAGGLTATFAPNPAMGETASLNVSQLLPSGRLNVRIVDMLGKTVWTAVRAVAASNAGMPVNTGLLKKGLYHVVVENAGRRTVVPFVKH